MRVLVLALSASTFLQWSGAKAHSGPLKVDAEFPGSILEWVDIAEPEFKREHLDLHNYRVSVVEADDSVGIVLRSTELPPGSREAGKYPTYEVEIDKKDKKIVSSHYSR